MQFQSDILNIPLKTSKIEELSGAGVAFVAAISSGLAARDDLLVNRCAKTYLPDMKESTRGLLCAGWRHAVDLISKYT